MKYKSLLIIFVAGLALMLLGIQMGAKQYYSLQLNGFRFTGFHSVDQKREKITLESFNNLTVDVSFVDVYVEESDHYGLEMLYASNRDLSVTNKNSLNITEKSARSSNPSTNTVNFSIGFGGGPINDYIKIYIPQGAGLDRISITASGNIRMEDLQTSRIDIKNKFGSTQIRDTQTSRLEIDNKFGSLNITDCSADQANLSLDNGSYTATNFQVDRLNYENAFGSGTFSKVNANSMNISTKNGNLTLRDINTHSMEVRSSFGSINGSSLTSRTTDVRSSNGNINLEGNFTDSLTAHSDFGSIKIKTSQSESYYNADYSTSFGSIYVNNKKLEKSALKDSKNNGFGKLRLSSKNGNISIDFKD